MNNRRGEGYVTMNRTPVYYALGISVAIILLGLAQANRYVTKVYEPTKTAMQGTFAARTALAYDSLTAQSATQVIEAQQTVNSVNATALMADTIRMTEVQQLTQNAMSTALAQPTITPDLGSGCEAFVDGNLQLMLARPGLFNGSKNTATPLPENSLVLVDGKLRDRAWVHVKFGEQTGFMRIEALKFKDSNCKPSVADLHFLATLLDQGWLVLVDDTFAANQYRWARLDNNEQIRSNSSGSESVLSVPANNQDFIFSTNVLNAAQLSAFKLFTNFKTQYSSVGSYVGFRFYENKESFYQLRFYPTECSFSVYEDDNEVFTSALPIQACTDRYYVLEMSFDADHYLELNINGVENGPIKIDDLEDGSLKGGINLSVHNLGMEFNYLVVTAPR